MSFSNLASNSIESVSAVSFPSTLTTLYVPPQTDYP